MKEQEKIDIKDIKAYTNKIFEEYLGFREMKRSIPDYMVDIDNDLSQKIPGQQFSIKARAECTNGQIILHVPENIIKKKSEAVLYHEITHILDFEKYLVLEDKCRDVDDDDRYNSIIGYTEYHASQIETLKLIEQKVLDVHAGKNIYMQRKGDKIIKSFMLYLTDFAGLAAQQLSQDGFPENEQDFIEKISLLFNYWGIRSIYLMCSADFNLCFNIMNKEKFEKIKQNLSLGGFNPIDEWEACLYGFLDEKQINKLREDFLTLFKIKVNCEHANGTKICLQ